MFLRKNQKDLKTLQKHTHSSRTGAVKALLSQQDKEQSEDEEVDSLKTPEAKEIDEKMVEMQEELQNSELFSTLKESGMLSGETQKKDSLLASGGASAPLNLQTKVRYIVRTLFTTSEIKNVVKHFEVIASYSSKILKLIKKPDKERTETAPRHRKKQMKRQKIKRKNRKEKRQLKKLLVKYGDLLVS